MRNLFRSPALILFALALVMSWSVAVSASARPQTGERNDRPSASQPAPEATTTQASQTPQDQSATPPSQATPQGQAGSSSGSQAAHPAAGAASIEDELQLTPDQKQKISTIVDDENRQIEAVRDDQAMTMDQKIQKVQDIRRVGAPKIKAVLTPEQLQKLAAIQERARQQQQNNNQAPPPPKQ